MTPNCGVDVCAVCETPRDEDDEDGGEGKSGSGSKDPPPKPPAPFDGTPCVTCGTQVADVVQIPCGHLNQCQDCAAKLMKGAYKCCPQCQQVVTGQQHVYEL